MILSLAIVIGFLSISALGARQNRIVGGVVAKAGDVPYIISLRLYGSHSCGGSIISEEYILTAAHCIRDAIDKMSVQFGRLNISFPMDSSVIGIEEVILNKDYDLYTLENDIALLKLKQKIKIEGITGIAQLPAQDEALPGGTPVLLAGWGFLHPGGPIPVQLQKVNIEVVDVEKCQKLSTNETKEHPKVLDTNVCAGVPEGGKGQCNGDSGGPLSLNGKVVGVVSWSVKPCTVKGYPGVFTRVASYRDWIKKHSGV